MHSMQSDIMCMQSDIMCIVCNVETVLFLSEEEL